jgi:plastocyanin
MTAPTRIRTLSITAALAGALLVGACGADDDGGDNTLRIDGVDIRYDSDTYESDAGPIRIEFRNRGSLAHNIVFRNAAGAPSASGEKEFVEAGKEQSFEVDLVSGEYAFYCSVPGHEAAGMVGSLVVR